MSNIVLRDITLADWAALKRFERPSDRLAQQLEEAMGKPFGAITMWEINDILPGLYDSFFINQVSAVLEIYEDLRRQVYG